MRKNAALDANSLLHSQPIENIDWPAVVGAEEVGLVVFPSVMKELDKKKYDGTLAVRKRAQAAIAKLRNLRNTGVLVRQGTSLIFEQPDLRSGEVNFTSAQSSFNNRWLVISGSGPAF